MGVCYNYLKKKLLTVTFSRGIQICKKKKFLRYFFLTSWQCENLGVWFLKVAFEISRNKHGRHLKKIYCWKLDFSKMKNKKKKKSIF
jgi:hypothetical protein